MSCMSFLPEKLGSSEEKSWTFFPPHYIGPLVYQNRKITPGLHPFAVHVANYCFRSRPYHKRLFKLLSSGMGNHCTFRSKSLNMFCFFFKKGTWDKEREISIYVACLLESRVKMIPDRFPQGIPGGSYYHASSHRSIISQFSHLDNIQ